MFERLAMIVVLGVAPVTGGPVPPVPPVAPVAPVMAAPATPALPTAVAPTAEAHGAPSAAKTHQKRRPTAPAEAERVDDAAASPTPTLSAAALRAELHGASAEGLASKTPGGERARLEALSADIARAREALRADTARLETRLKSPQVPGGGDERAAAREGGGPAAAFVTSDTPAPSRPLVRDPGRGQIEIVSKAMAGMKPEQAAAVITRIDRVLGADILRRMKAADAGGIMAALRPEVAAEIATEIAVRLPRLELPKEKP